MDSIYIENFRCFKEGREVPLAPLTLLVGENSTGKTSFMAMIQTLWNAISRRQLPDFNESPYNLGNFNHIAYRNGRKKEQSSEIMAGFSINGKDSKNSFSYRTIFEEAYRMPVPTGMQLSHEKVWCQASFADNDWEIGFGTPNGSWVTPQKVTFPQPPPDEYMFMDPSQAWMVTRSMVSDSEAAREYWRAEEGHGVPNIDDMRQVSELISRYIRTCTYEPENIYSIAPIRSKPHRIYSLSSIMKDPEGSNIPSYLADIYFRDKEKWSFLKKTLESYGEASGLFNGISIESIGDGEHAQFQINIGKPAGKKKKLWRSLADVGYGISQVLPIIIEVGEFNQATYLLQQPEVHLHPRAQAALGTFFSDVVAEKRGRLIIETHSDYLLDRIKMEVRDDRIDINPDDVLILFFEHVDECVRIHPITIDKEGNTIGAPISYGRFFMDEIRHSLGL